MVTTGGRAYRVLGVLGKGGFGKVYRARLESPSGFVKDVAIKVLNENLTPEAIQRFRDEARILGLINDRAVVSAEPPIQLDGRWVLIMDYAEGLSAKDVLKQHGPLPPSVALEVVQEVARVLDRVWNQPGPDGEPLHLLHRDIKPPNIQISSAGEA
ncbi:MAG: protein kinase, partial [Proteobacteria bacterium]|nr:protein kinase [Pseudomonadota bacterium]